LSLFGRRAGLVGLIEFVEKPEIKKVLKYGSIILGFVTVLKTLGDLPDILHKDKTAFPIIGHFLWHLLKFPLEFLAIGIPCLFLVISAFKVITLDFVELAEHDAVMATLVIISSGIAIWLMATYGFLGTFTLVLHYGKYFLIKWTKAYK
jgi:hypothetical protein